MRNLVKCVYYIIAMNFAKLFFFFAALAMLFACGEVEGGFDGSHGKASSSSGALGSSSSSDCIPSIEMDLNWQIPRESSQVHGSIPITLSPFEISYYLITQGQYKAIMGENPSMAPNDEHPVDGVTWFKAVEFANKLSEKTCQTIRLPTEAEWEYTANPEASVIVREENYWEWTNDCYRNFPFNGIMVDPSPTDCLLDDDIVRKGLIHNFDARYSTPPNCGLDCGSISFRVILKK
jgi:hypothetical protein